MAAAIIPLSVILTSSGSATKSTPSEAQNKIGGCGDSNQCRDWEVFQDNCCHATRGSGCSSHSDCQIGTLCVGGICGGEEPQRCGGDIWQCAFGPDESRCINGKEYKCGSDLCLQQVKDYCGNTPPTTQPTTSASSDTTPSNIALKPAESSYQTTSSTTSNLGDKGPNRTCSGYCVSPELGKSSCSAYGVSTAGGSCVSGYLCCGTITSTCADGTKIKECSSNPSNRGYRCEYNSSTNTMTYVAAAECGYSDCQGECLYYDPGATCSDYGKVFASGTCTGTVACCDGNVTPSTPSPTQYLPVIVSTNPPRPTATPLHIVQSPSKPPSYSNNKPIYTFPTPTPAFRPTPVPTPKPTKTIFDAISDLFTTYQKYIDQIYGLYGINRN